MKGKYLEFETCDSFMLAEQLLEKIDFDFDIVVYVAKSGYLIAEAIATLTRKDLYEIKSTRRELKDKFYFLIKPISYLPKSLKKIIKSRERKLKFYDINEDRTLYYDADEFKKKDVQNILVVDDTIDTGYTINNVLHLIKQIYPDANTKIATVNYYKDKDTIRPDYYLYEDAIISGPWSSENKDHSKFLNFYKERHKYD